MSSLKLLLLTLLVLFCCQRSPALLAADVLVGENAYSGYQSFVGKRDVLGVDDFSGIESRREVLEIVLLQHALRLGGYWGHINLKPARQTYLRRLRLIADGQYDLWANTAWLQEAKRLEDEVYISSALIRRGEYIVGLYTHPSNHRALAARTLEDVQALSAVSSKSWSADWNTLETLRPVKMVNNTNWYSLAKVLASGRADFMLAPFQAGDNQTLYHKQLDQELGVTEVVELVPIPKVQIYLDDSRHWLISRKSHDGHKIHRALERGLALLDSSGKRKQALLESGFIPPDISKRVTLNPEQVANIPVAPTPLAPADKTLPL